MEEKIEGTGSKGRICRQLLNELQEKRRDWKLKQEALDHTAGRTRFGRHY
jgi:hypothetical protein